jgi:integrase
MPQKSDSTVHILEGKATLYKREGSPFWSVRYKAYGKWERATTKRGDVDEAKDKAVEIVSNAWFRERNDLPVVSKRFKSVARLAVQRMEDLQKANQGKATYKTYIQAINRYLIEFFGNHNIDRINGALLHDFAKWRIEEFGGKTPSASVINNHNSALNRVFDEALERGYLTKYQVPVLRNDGLKTEKRPTITIDEYTTLHRAFRGWLAEARKGNESLLRHVLRDYILILSHTGIRPGTEAMNLKWHSVYFFEKNGRKYLGVTVNGKTGKRHVTVRHGAVLYFDRLRKMNPEWAGMTFEQFLKKRVDQYVFRIKGKDRKGKEVWKDMTATFGRMFTRLLTKAEILLDKETNKPRTLYSLRHMYATFAITYNRMSVYTLAEHMGTSVKMIEDHYGQLLMRDKAAEVAGDKEWDRAMSKREHKQLDLATQKQSKA